MIIHRQTTQDLPLCNNFVTIGRGKHKRQYCRLYCGFDIETTNIKGPKEWEAYAYHFQFSIYTDTEQHVYLFRTWEKTLEFFDLLAAKYTADGSRLIIGVANLGFEFQFLRRRLEWSEEEYDFFAKENRQPLLATYKNIELREVLSISGGSLEDLAHDYTTTQKLKGDLDFSVLRNSTTPLTHQEEQYCINDVAIIAEFEQYFFSSFLDNGYIPLTKTSILQREIKDELSNLCRQRDEKTGLRKGTSLGAYRQYLAGLFPDYNTYKLWFDFLFRGGYVHACALLANITLDNIRPYDITSSYPARMLLANSYYPVSPFREVSPDPAYLSTHCCIIYATFTNIRSKTPHTVESKHKIISAVNPRYDNGRLFSADEISVILTELDFDTYTKFYSWTGLNIHSMKISRRGKLPKYITNVLTHHYRTKQHLKATGQKSTVQYAISKARVNSCYGLLVKRIKRDKIKYTNDDEWTEDTTELNYREEISKLIAPPQWGIWVSAAARHELLTVLYELTLVNDPTAYGDTDSLKTYDSPASRSIIANYNARQRAARWAAGLYDDYFSDLGDFIPEVDGTLTAFKTLGAKRYLAQDGAKIECTVAGLPKLAIHSMVDPFNEFTAQGYTFTADDSLKLTAHYCDHSTQRLINNELMAEETSIALFKIPFKISLKEEYQTFIHTQQSNRPSY